ncbi:MAG: GTP 3',8-cyclase MoaA [Synergistaceae bacterium]|nr:GTP 3',8-cyclase MoaA [Synergistaceae bacterium]
MRDLFNREISYMRISLTDKCNLNCRYCKTSQPENFKSDIMSDDEIILIIEAASELGINKIRFTGGEPLLRKNIVSICSRTREIQAINEICITTNGIFLPELAKSLRESGVERLNISLDTLNPGKYSYITRGGCLDDALRGIRAAQENNFRVKLNTVLINGFNDDEIRDLAEITINSNIDVRFIELMPMLEFNDAKKFMSSQKILEILPELVPLKNDGVAKLYKLPDSHGNIGFISPISNAFCSSCNRIRLTADGYIKPCLHSETEIFVRHKNKSELKSLIIQAIESKPERHALISRKKTQSLRPMNRIGG